MKKSIIILALLTIAACKKDEKSAVSQQDNSKNTTSSVQPSVSDSAAVAPAVPVTAVYQDSLGVYHLKYNLEVGKTYPFNSREVNKQTLSMDGNSQSITQETAEQISFKVLSFKDDVYHMQINIGSKKITTKADGQQFVLDTNSNKPSDPDQARMWQVYKALSQLSFTMDMDVHGKASNIQGMDAIYTKAKSTLSGDLKGKELDDFINILKQSFNPEMFKNLFESSVVRFPEKGLKIGEKWNNDPAKKDMGYNQLTKVDDKTAEITLSGNIPPQNHSETKEGVTLTASLKGTQSGKITLDTKSGWVNKANLDLFLTETQTAKKGEQKQQMEKKSENHTYLNQ
ncbi:MAG: DUF6263 family protein [Flavobacteriaceae bacterium]|jgi:hypothetical protein|nr:DUF6263 family protein [Flavobacteriaceae bacterium]